MRKIGEEHYCCARLSVHEYILQNPGADFDSNYDKQQPHISLTKKNMEPPNFVKLYSCNKLSKDMQLR